MLGAVMFAHKASGQVIDAIISLAENAAMDPWELPTADELGAELERFLAEENDRRGRGD